MIEDKNDKIKKLKAEIDEQKATVGELTNEIEDAQDMIADIVAFVKEATEIRNTGKKENAISVKDAKQAQDSLTNAIAVLTEFYKSSGEIAKEPWEFIQEPVAVKGPPSTWENGGDYSGVDGGGAGIISILETVLSDFENMEADTKAQEAADQKEYEDAMKANDIEKAGRTQEVEMKTQEMKRRNDKIASLEGQKKNTEAELEKTEQYDEDLGPACKDGDSSYGDRKAARSKEIKALQKAQVTLEDAFKEKASNFLQIRSHRA